MSVGHEDAGHEFLLAVVAEGVTDHDLLLRQLALQIQGVTPVEIHLGCESKTSAQHTVVMSPSCLVTGHVLKHGCWTDQFQLTHIILTYFHLFFGLFSI